MKTQKIESFKVIGIAVRTTNENGQAGEDIPQLWGKWVSEGLQDQIPNKIDQNIYCIYTVYEKDHTKPYTTILGCKVNDLTIIPDGMVGLTIAEANYQKFVAEGDLMQGAVFNEWTKIWNADLDRAFTADFEVYDERSRDSAHATVDIFIALNS